MLPLHMWPLSVFVPAARSVKVSLKTFQFIIDPILLLLKLVDCLSKALRFDMIILNLFRAIGVNLKFLAVFARLSVSTQRNSFVRESGPRLTVAVVVADVAKRPCVMRRLMLVNLFLTLRL